MTKTETQMAETPEESNLGTKATGLLKKANISKLDLARHRGPSLRVSIALNEAQPGHRWTQLPG